MEKLINVRNAAGIDACVYSYTREIYGPLFYRSADGFSGLINVLSDKQRVFRCSSVHVRRQDFYLNSPSFVETFLSPCASPFLIFSPPCSFHKTPVEIFVR